MGSLRERLTRKLDVYAKVETVNELDELCYDYVKIKSVWAEVKQQKGALKEGQGNTTSANISYKVTVRISAIPGLTGDMYFMYGEQRLDVEYFNDNFVPRDRIEIFCKLEVK